MKILHINQLAGRGGAAGICLALHNTLRAGGHESTVLVGRCTREISGVVLIEHDRYRSAWGRFWMAAAQRLIQHIGRIRGTQRVSERWLPRLASPSRFWSWWAGHEDFDFPGTGHLLEQAPFMPDVLHLHNLHGDYFDLRQLPRLSRAIPTIITLHDAWLLAGHCAHSFDCERWKTGCGSCPRLNIPPTLRRDGTAFNWLRKQRVFRNSRLSVACPSQWLADKVRRSILMPALDRLKVIPNGVDTSVFKPGDKAAVRDRLGWPREAFVVMFAANGVFHSMWKDYPTMREAMRLVGEKANGEAIRFFAIGDVAPAEQAGAVKIEFLPYRDSLAECYQAADVYLHAAKADTFPTTILEALACGTPVVATSVGGIPEQVRSIHSSAIEKFGNRDRWLLSNNMLSELTSYTAEDATGVLVPPGDVAAMAEAIEILMTDEALRKRLGVNASEDARQRFDLERCTHDYLKWYKEIIEPETPKHTARGKARTEETQQLPDTMPSGAPLPKVSIVTPSFNQGQFIEETIRSVLEQGYPNLEYVIIDGNSTDGSIDIIRKYEQQLAYWVSEPDRGQYDAINKGFSKTTGEIMAWLNSDDKYTPWAFSIVAEIFSTFPQVEWLTTSSALHWDRLGRAVECTHRGGFNRHAFFKGANLPSRDWFAGGWIQQESTFWRRSLWDRAGGQIDALLKLAGDFELWTKFFHHTDLYTVCTPLGGFRVHGNQKTAHHMQAYLEEAEVLLRRCGGHPYGRFESAIRRFLNRSVGRGQINRLPLPVKINNRLHIFYPVKRCVWSREGWQIVGGYIV